MVKLRTLVSEQTAVTPAPQPAGFLALCGAKPLPMVESGQESGTYVGFAPGKGGQVATFAAAGLSEGDPYLKHSEGRIEPLRPLKFMVIDATQLWVESDGEYKPLSVVTEKPESFKNPHKELIESILLVFTPTGIVPARCSWRTTKCNAIRTAIESLHLASGEEWLKMSPAHAASARVPHAFGRFTATVSLRKKTGKGSGHPYVEARATIAPSTMAEIDALSTYFSDPENEAAAMAVKQAHQQRVEYLRGLVK